MTITSGELAVLIMLWFLVGRQLGHIGAKYSRSKDASVWIMLILVCVAVVFTVYLSLRQN